MEGSEARRLMASGRRELAAQAYRRFSRKRITLVLATIVNVSDRPIVAIFVGLFLLGFMLFLVAPEKVSGVSKQAGLRVEKLRR
jgi:hypothetical protein